MKTTILWSLIGLNALLVFMLVWQPATAIGQARRPGDYMLIPGEVQGQPTDIVYVIDTTNGVLGGIAYDESAKRIIVMPGPISLDQIFQRNSQ